MAHSIFLHQISITVCFQSDYRLCTFKASLFSGNAVLGIRALHHSWFLHSRCLESRKPCAVELWSPGSWVISQTVVKELQTRSATFKREKTETGKKERKRCGENYDFKPKCIIFKCNIFTPYFDLKKRKHRISFYIFLPSLCQLPTSLPPVYSMLQSVWNDFLIIGRNTTRRRNCR